MSNDFDVETFLCSLRATKPPWECPKCQKVYKSYSGMEYHLQNFDHTTPAGTPIKPAATRRSKFKFGKKKKSNRFGRRSPSPIDFLCQTRETLTWAEAQRLVEVETEGRVYRLNIDEKLDIISDSDIDKDDEIPPKNDVLKNKLKNTSAKGGNNLKDATNITLPTALQTSQNKLVINPDVSLHPSKLPKPSFRLLPEYDKETTDAPNRSSNYYCFIEKPSEDLETEIEYDMDEEDAGWLKLMNKQRDEEGLNEVTSDQLELLLDRFEKEAYFEQTKHGLGTNGSQLPIDEDAVCCVCNDGECQNSNVILFCDMCDLAVHQECYGVPYIPEGQWLCRRCLESPSCPVDCCLCPNRSGAFKQTDDGRWAHVVCALWIPEVGFGNTVFLEPIDGLKNVPPARWRLSCYLCKQRNAGACIQCHRTNCYAAFHVTCAQQAGLHMKMDARRKSTRNGVTVTVIKEAYCDAHSSTDGQFQTRFNGQQSPANQHKAMSDKLKKTRKLIAEKRNEAPQISIPYVPTNKISSIARQVSLQKKNDFIQRLLSYWTLKRQSRNGVPLLRRLQSHVHQHKANGPRKSSQQHKLIEQLKYWHRLRHDLERARLLIELIRKRERLKKEIVRISQALSELRLAPLVVVMRRVLSELDEIDVARVFAEPVDPEEAPNYHSVIKKPMDFSTMAVKVNSHEYKSFADFQSDFNLVVSNCLRYNNRDTIFYKLALNMRDNGGACVRDALKEVEATGFDQEAGLLLSELDPTKTPEAIVKSDPSLTEQLDVLLTRLHEASSAQKTKKIKTEITSLRRKILQEDEGSKPSTVTNRRRMSTRRFSADDAEATSSPTENEAIHSDVDSTLKVSSKIRPVAFKKSRGSRKRICSEKATEVSPWQPRSKRSLLARAESCPVGDDVDGAGEERSTRPRTRESASFQFSSSTSLSSSPETGASSTSHKPSGDVNRRSAILFKKKPRHRSSCVITSNTNPVVVIDENDALNLSVCDATGNMDYTVDLKNKDSFFPNNQKSDPLDASTNGFTSPQDENVFNEKASPVRRDNCVGHYKGFSRTTSLTDSTSSDERTERRPVGRKKRSVSYSVAHHSTIEPPPFFLDDGSELPFEYLRRQSCVSATEDELDDDDFSYLSPLDLVWAKCRGYPPYPALLIDPNMPRSGFCHNRIPIPVPPLDVLQVGDKRIENGNRRIYLVLFFDTKRTWQWLPRNKLTRLGTEPESDRLKLAEGRRPAVRRNVEAAYKRALRHRSKVMGEIPDSDDEGSGCHVEMNIGART